jgi:hypothetical protein
VNQQLFSSPQATKTPAEYQDLTTASLIFASLFSSLQLVVRSVFVSVSNLSTIRERVSEWRIGCRRRCAGPPCLLSIKESTSPFFASKIPKIPPYFLFSRLGLPSHLHSESTHRSGIQVHQPHHREPVSRTVVDARDSSHGKKYGIR